MVNFSIIAEHFTFFKSQSLGCRCYCKARKSYCKARKSYGYNITHSRLLNSGYFTTGKYNCSINKVF